MLTRRSWTHSLYRSASVSSLSTSSGPKKNSLDVTSLLSAMTDRSSRNDASSYNNNIKITSDECDLYAGAFFRPSRSDRPADRGKPDQLPPDLFAGTDPYRQFLRFEQSVFKLDRLLNMRHFNKLNAMPDRETVNASEMLNTAPSASNVTLPAEEIEDWLGNVVSTDPARRSAKPDTYREKKKEVLMSRTVSDVLKKAMMVGFETARAIEQEVDVSLVPPKTAAEGLNSAQGNSKETPIPVVVSMATQVKNAAECTPMPIFDMDALLLLSPGQIIYLLESFGAPQMRQSKMTHMNLVRSWLSLTVKKLEQCIGQGHTVLDDKLPIKVVSVLSSTKNLPDIVRIIQNKQQGEAQATTISTGREWTPERDVALVGYVEAFLRRREQVNKAFEEWKAAHGPVLPHRLETLPASTIWRLVARELGLSAGSKSAAHACRKRYISLQRSSL